LPLLLLLLLPLLPLLPLLLPLLLSSSARLPANAPTVCGPALLSESNGSAQYPRCPVSFQRTPQDMSVADGPVVMQHPLPN
jgi:hypothetical protein